MKNTLFSISNVRLPDLTSGSGYGNITIDEELYFEYNFKLIELLKLSDKIHEIAAKQLGNSYPRGY